MSEYMLWGFGVYNESAARQFSVPGFGFMIDEYTAAVTNQVINIV